jgi:hypothetical protein
LLFWNLRPTFVDRRQCCDKLRKRNNLISQEKIIVNELKETYERGRLKRRQLFAEEGPSTKRPCILSANSPTTSQTKATVERGRVDSPPAPVLPEVPTPISHSTPVKSKETSETSVNVTVTWPSQTRQRELHSDLQSLGKILVRGTYMQADRKCGVGKPTYKKASCF